MTNVYLPFAFLNDMFSNHVYLISHSPLRHSYLKAIFIFYTNMNENNTSTSIREILLFSFCRDDTLQKRHYWQRDVKSTLGRNRQPIQYAYGLSPSSVLSKHVPSVASDNARSSPVFRSFGLGSRLCILTTVCCIGKYNTQTLLILANITYS